MKNLKVLNVRTHIGGMQGKTSHDAIKDRVEMELTPVGVQIKQASGAPFIRKGPSGNLEAEYYLIEPYSNCTEIAIYANQEENVPVGSSGAPNPDGNTPRRGRPPGPKIVT